jgi:ribosomal protein S18 acetylase RimI-like enzyme
MIRPTTAAETPALLAIAESTGVFSALDMDALRGVLADFHAGRDTETHILVSSEREGQVIGFAYYAPASMTDRTWYLWWIAVGKQVQARGVGKELLDYLEQDIRGRHGRLLVLETSGLPSYELTRRFYLKNGYEQAAVVKDYYADNHDMIVFRKRL